MKETRQLFVACTFLIIFLLIGQRAYAQAPANDECGAAQVLTPGTACVLVAGTTTGATQSNPPVSCGSLNPTQAIDVWYQFEATSPNHTVYLESYQYFMVEVEMAGCGGPTLGCGFAEAGQAEVVLTGLDVGVNYWIRVYGVGFTHSGDFSICVTTPTPGPGPVNDECAGAIVLTPSTACTPVPGTNVGATESEPPATCNGNQSATAFDVWYQFTATSTLHAVQVETFDPFNAVIEARAGACNGTILDCIDAKDVYGTEYLQLGALTVGETYFIRVYNRFGARGNFTICVFNPPAPPVNDECAGAIELTPGTVCVGVPGTTVSATQSEGPIQCGYNTGPVARDVWYKFTATATNHIVTAAPITWPFETALEVRAGSCAGPLEGCISSSQGTNTHLALGELTIGETYYIRLHERYSLMGTFIICVSTPSPPANDACSGSIPLTASPICVPTFGTTEGAAPSIQPSTCNGYNNYAARDVWYSFTATAVEQTVTVVGLNGFWAIVEARSGACNGTSFACSDDGTLELSGLTPGAPYLLRVHGGYYETGTFSICITDPQAPAINDECAAAIVLTPSPTCASMLGGNLNATESVAPVACNGNTSTEALDVWFQFTATTAQHTVVVESQGTFDAVVDVRTGSCTGASLACADATAAGGTESLTLTGLTPGQTYRVRVYGRDGATGTFMICVSAPPVNDQCANATPLAPGANCPVTSGTTVEATQSIAPGTCNGSTSTSALDVWYEFTANSFQNPITVVGDGTFDPVVELRSNGCNGQVIQCVDATGSGGTETLQAYLGTGEQYFVRVYGRNGTTGTFTICIEGPPAPANDDCWAAQVLTPDTTCVLVAGTTTGATQFNPPLSCGSLSPTRAIDVWYRFEATSPNHTVYLESYQYFMVEVEMAGCGGPALGCGFVEAGQAEVVLTGLDVGVNYWIRVYGVGFTYSGNFSICVTTPTPGPGPVNDECAGAIVLTPSTNCTPVPGTNVGATESEPPATCNGNQSATAFDVWYQFTATSTLHAVQVETFDPFNAVIEARAGACNGAILDCIDAKGIYGSEYLQLDGLTVGETYFIRVYNRFGARGNFTICVFNPPAPPVNDECGGAIELTPGTVCVGVPGTTVSATQSEAPIQCGYNTGLVARDVWYKFTAITPRHTVTSVPITWPYEAAIEVRAGGCTGPVVGCTTSSQGSNTHVALGELTIGETYYIRLHERYSEMGDFSICVSTPPAPPVNDRCTEATPLTVGPVCVPTLGTTVDAAPSIQPSTCNGANNYGALDVWYQFTATGPGQTVTVVGLNGFYPKVEARAGTCNGTSIDCSDHGTLELTGLTPGAPYFLRVYDGYYETGTFTICVTDPQAPAINDDCAATIVLTPSPTCVPTLGANFNSTESLAPVTCDGNTSSSALDVWFQFAATDAEHTVVVESQGTFDAVVDVRAGTCNGTSLACADATAVGGTESLTLTGLTPGQIYRVRVYGRDGATGAFNICVLGPPPPPANDECVGAIIVLARTYCDPITGTNVSATQSIAPAACSGMGSAPDVWYKFYATAPNLTVKLEGHGAFDAVLEVLQGPSCSGASLGCANNTAAGGIEAVELTGLTVNTVYFVRVYGAGGGTGTFDLCVYVTPPPPDNDECAQAQGLDTHPYLCLGAWGQTINATQSVAPIACGGPAATVARDVWFHFTATSTNHQVEVDGNGAFDPVVDVRSGPCNGTSIGCADATGLGDTELLTLNGLTVGETYYVRVYPADGTAGWFIVCIKTLPPDCPTAPAAPANGAILCPDQPATLSWPAVSGATSYDLYFGPAGSPSFVANVAGTAYTTASLAAGTYFWQVHPVGEGGTAGGCAEWSFIAGDPQVPTIICPADATVSANADCQAMLGDYAPGAAANDNCGMPVVTQLPAIGTMLGLGDTQVTLVASDGTGNSSGCTMIVTVTDDTAPAVTCPGSITQINAVNQCTAIVNYTAPVGTDNCSGAITIQTAGLAPGSTFPVGVTTNTFRVTDQAGNSATCAFTVTVNDVQPPMITCPPNLTLNVDAQCSAPVGSYTPATLSDNCTANPTVVQTPVAAALISGHNTLQTITLTANDGSGNTASCTLIVTLRDMAPPTIACPPNVTLNANATCSAPVGNYAPAMLSDNCNPSPMLTQTPAASAIMTGHNATQTVTLTANDGNGNTASCSLTITLRDATPPAITCPPNLTLNVDAACSATLGSYTPTNLSDNCNPSPVVTQAPAAATALTGITTHSVALTANDGNGNTASCSLTVTLRDVTPPAIACPPNVTLNAGPMCTTAVGAYGPSMLSDNCTANPSVTQSPASSAILSGHNTTQTVTLTADDGNGNMASCMLVITLRDVTPPAIVCPPNVTLNANAACSATAGSYLPLTLSDNCNASMVVTQTPTPSTILTGHNTTQTVTLTANDGNGNTASCSLTVTLRDVTPPAITCPPNLTLNADAACTTTAGSYLPLTLSDNCNPSPTVMQTPAAATTLSGSIHTITLTANDGNGNTATCALTVTLRDVTPPTITCPPNVTLNADATCSATLGAYTPATLSDNCNASPTLTQAPAATTVLTGHNTTQTVVLTANDGNGNSASCSLTVTLRDVTPPAITCPPNVTLNANAQCSAPVGAYTPAVLSDNCNPSPTVNQTPAPTAILINHNTTQTVALTANDGNGNTTSCALTVTLRDMTPPTITCPPNVTLNADAACSATLGAYAPVTLSDNCNPSPVMTQAPAAATVLTGHNSTQTVTLTANDGNGNTSSCSLTVTLRDVTPPTVTCKPFTASLDAAGTVTVAPSAVFQSGADNCGTVNAQSASPASFSCANLGANTVTLTVNDGNGNTATCHAIVMVQDVLPPAVVCQFTQVALNAAGQATITPSMVYQSGSDNCGTVNLVSVTPSTFGCNNLGVNAVTLMVNDGNGNTASCTATVGVKDETRPTMLCQNITINLSAAGMASIVPAQINAGSFDNCAIVSLSAAPTTFTCAHVGPNAVTLSATDPSGNVGTCTATVTVRDVTPPTALCKPAIVNLGANGTASILASLMNNGSFDQCSIVSLTTVPATVNCNNVGTMNVTLVVTDVGGNTATCSAALTVRDVVPPTALCKAATIFLNGDGQATLAPAAVDNGSWDNCTASAALVRTVSPPVTYSCANLASPVTVTLRVRDASSNSSTCLATVTVKDNIAPTAACTNVTVNLPPSGGMSIPGASFTAGSYDNCSVVGTLPNSVGFTSPGTYMRTFTVRDYANNTASCTATITVLPPASAPVEPGGTSPTVSLEALVYPNPTTGAAELAFDLVEEQPYEIRVFDLNGRAVWRAEGIGVGGRNSHPLELGHVPPGLYLVQLGAGERQAVVRVVVQR